MGWWFVEGGKALVGDQPIETLRDALLDISSQYEKALKRRPTRAEWEALILSVLVEKEGEPKLIDQEKGQGKVKKVVIEAG